MYVFKSFYIYLRHINVLSVYMYVYHVHAWCPDSQKKKCDPLELQLWVTMWVLGVGPESSERTGALNHWAISSAPWLFIMTWHISRSYMCIHYIVYINAGSLECMLKFLLMENLVKKISSGAVEMAWWIRHLLYKRETHNSDPQTLIEAGQNGTLLQLQHGGSLGQAHWLD